MEAEVQCTCGRVGQRFHGRSDYGDGAAIGVELAKKQIMLDAFLEADPWR